MTDASTWPAILAVALTSLITLSVGAIGLRLSRTTSDFYVASRAVSPWWNASAIGGEYLSAASFLGVAGLILTFGSDILWYPVGYTAGYLILLALVAAPLRRSGAYTLPDFAQIRLRSPTIRRMSSVLVMGIGWLYLLPQFHGAGLALRTVSGAPQWVGGMLVAAIVLVNVVLGGMRSITFVQAVQFWLKLTAIMVPVLFMVMVWSADGLPNPAAQGPPVARQTTTVTLPNTTEVTIERTTTLIVDGETRRFEPGTTTLAAGSEVTIPSGQAVPIRTDQGVVDGHDWAEQASSEDGREYPIYRLYSLLLALVFGTMGLPHVLVRFYTNPDGRTARRTTLIVLPLLALFYLFPPFYGALGRVYAPDLLLTGQTEAVVLLLPERVVQQPWGIALSALVTAGAFAAFLSTSSGLTVSVAGVLSQDLLRGRMRNSVAGFRLGAALAVALPAVLSLFTQRVSLADIVVLAFAVAASTFCPLLILGIWWRGLSRRGAQVGMAVGGLLATIAAVATMAGGTSSPLVNALLAQPAAWSVPIAFAVMIVVSLMTKATIPPDAARTMVRLHAPESLGLYAVRR